MDLLPTFILSVIEGITEFLPISSTAHLVLASHLLQIPQTDFHKSFEIIVQLGAVSSIIVLYAKKILENLALIPKIVIAFLPSAVFGFIFYPLIKSLLIGNLTITLWALLLGGILLLFLSPGKSTQSLASLSFHQALKIGLFQVLSMIPGVSRAAATIVGGWVSGLNKKDAVEFSFLLAVPTMLGATVLDLAKMDFAFSTQEIKTLVVGFLVALITAAAAVRFLVNFVNSHSTLKSFGIYRILLATIFFLIFT
jgi:undecaprenyl-diphosphatase